MRREGDAARRSVRVGDLSKCVLVMEKDSRDRGSSGASRDLGRGATGDRNDTGDVRTPSRAGHSTDRTSGEEADCREEENAVVGRDTLATSPSQGVETKTGWWK